MADRSIRDVAGAPTVAVLLADPAASFAVGDVARRWAARDCIDAAVDARTPCTVFEVAADPTPGGAS